METSEIIEVLEEHSVRATANRIELARQLAAAGRPMSLTELEDEMPTVDKSNIFRSLTAFREHHLVHVIEDGSNGVRYELCLSHDHDHDEDQHSHFFCEVCLKTYCLEDIKIPQVELPAGYELHSVNYVLKGVCPSCAAKQH